MRRLILAAAALLAVPAALLPAAAADAAVPADPVAGTDVSYNQCSGAADDGFAPVATVPDFVVVGLNVGVNDGTGSTVNPCLAAEVAWARTAAGSSRAPFELYLNVQHPDPHKASWWPDSDRTRSGATVRTPYGHCRGKDDAACAFVYGTSIAAGDLEQAAIAGIVPGAERWWLDVEGTNDWIGSATTNRAVVEGMAARLRAAHVSVGLYSTHAYWSAIIGSVAEHGLLAGLPSWLSAAITVGGAAENCSHAPLVPRSRVVLAQARLSTDVDADLSCAKLAADPKPHVHGSAHVGHVLRVATGTWAPDGVHLAYAWLRNGRVIPRATAATYRLRAADRHDRISVRVTGTLPGYSRGVRESAATRVR